MNRECTELDRAWELIKLTNKPHITSDGQKIDPKYLFFDWTDPDFRYPLGPEWIRCDED